MKPPTLPAQLSFPTLYISLHDDSPDDYPKIHITEHGVELSEGLEFEEYSRWIEGHQEPAQPQQAGAG